MSLIQAVNVRQRYEERDVLKNINLSVERGDVLAFIGPTGAGKTTLLRILDLLDKPHSGKVYFDGMEVTSTKRLQLDARRRMAYVHQKPVVFTASVFSNVAYALKWRRTSSVEVKNKTERVLKLVGLAGYEKRNAKTLSGGETQRVAIARALVTGPEVLFLDEPTANMDPVSTLKIEEVLAHIIREKRTTVVMSTHDMMQGQRLASRVAVLVGGEILQIDSPTAIFSSPNCTRVAEFVGVENILSGTVTGKDDKLLTISPDTGTGHIQAIADRAVGERVYVLIRPEDITISLHRDVSSARNVFKGKITRINPAGPLARVAVDCGFPLLGLVTRKSAEELGLIPGTEAYASFKATAIRVIKSVHCKQP